MILYKRETGDNYTPFKLIKCTSQRWKNSPVMLGGACGQKLVHCLRRKLLGLFISAIPGLDFATLAGGGMKFFRGLWKG